MNKVADISGLDILNRSVSIDLEVDPEKAQIFALAAVVCDVNAPRLVARDNIASALGKLDAFCRCCHLWTAPVLQGFS